MNREFSIVSMGTERETDSNGYMCVSNYDFKKNIRILCPQEHNGYDIDFSRDNLIIKGNPTYEEITVSRFQLIGSLSIPNWISNNLSVAVIGAGSVGIGTCFELLRKKFVNINLWSRRQVDLRDINQYIKCSQGWNSSPDIYIECTGEKEIVEKIFKYALPKSIIILTGTPRNIPNINVLDIHRKNLTVLGGHELTGWELEDRQQIFSEIIKWHLDNKWNIRSLVRKHIGIKEKENILNKTFKEPFHIMF
ncbi:hypothetical protein [Priestia koreensis]|uniref:hypothetical protein n=1 Tax=Priestia koreensis TaxID=284581 RepID=UPI00203D6F50|nr:hypothetical protein [Priestia koreensis]MCM3005854.1 hypothetical protein [Priestia koreensis]